VTELFHPDPDFMADLDPFSAAWEGS
jgi:hypothetical protein